LEADIQKLVGDDVLKIGQGKALKNKWITKDGAGFIRAVSHSPASPFYYRQRRGVKVLDGTDE
jgi:phenylalanyl-tRNA synthetase alpha chain